MKNCFTEEILSWVLPIQKVEFKNKHHLKSRTLLFEQCAWYRYT